MNPIAPLPDARRLEKNIPLFIAFRVLFNARFYYPIIGVLFLDLGLTLEQYALLNVVWAVAIVVLEIPSGALADAIGRRRMVIAASFLMVVEMLIFAFAPAGNPALLFWLLVLNRVLSGAAEASASGADEALAYDSLPEDARETRWPRVLESLMRWKSGAFFLAMLAGAALYDDTFLTSVLSWTGISLAPGETIRWPVYATLASAILCFLLSLRLVEPPRGRDVSGEAGRVSAALANIWQGALHVFTVRRVLLLLLVALACDSFLRLFLTFASNYYRAIELPPVMNGLLGSGLALLGFVAAPLAKHLVARRGPVFNFVVVVLLVLVGLVGVAFAVPHWGAAVVLPIGLGMMGLQFFVSHYLNLWTDSDVRATVLSFRGVAFNLGYGAAGLIFAWFLSINRDLAPGLPGEDAVFRSTILWLPPAFLFSLLLLLPLCIRSRTERQTE